MAIVGVSDQEALAQVAQEITVLGREALALSADVANRAEVDRCVQQVLDRWGRIDILVNNAGIIHPTRLEEISEGQWQATLAVHLTGTFHCAQAVVPAMKAQSGGQDHQRGRACGSARVVWRGRLRRGQGRRHCVHAQRR